MTEIEAKTKTVGDAVLTCTPFSVFPRGAAMFARVLLAGKPLAGALTQAIDAIRSAGVDPSKLATLPPAVAMTLLMQHADVGALAACIPDLVANIVRDEQLVVDLLSGMSVYRPGQSNTPLSSRQAIGAVVGYDYQLFVAAVWFAVEANYRGPLADAFGGLLRGKDPGDPPAAPTP